VMAGAKTEVKPIAFTAVIRDRRAGRIVTAETANAQCSATAFI